MTTSFVVRGKSSITRLAVPALVVVLLSGAVPASAHSEAINTSTPCPSTTPSAGFTDIGTFDASTQLAINCLAALGISTGTTATTFSPGSPVPREHMALFLVREAVALGMSVPSPIEQGFEDIGGLSTESQTAINQLAQLGITTGTSASTFSPAEIVTRWQMALFLYRLATTAGVTLTNLPAHSEFGDLGGVLDEAVTAINALADTHIALGTAEAVFSPNQEVLRWQMALFLTRVLAADAGVTIVSAVGYNGGSSSPGILSTGDQILVTFSGAVTPIGVTVITLLDSDGTTATLTCLTNVFCGLAPSVVGQPIDVLLISLGSDITTSGGSVPGINPTAQIETITGLVSASGAPIDVAGSGSGRSFGGF
ncbi:MAG TPA: S-layer homology domain-containing protein [Acidimicrobiia bacterium]|nr:S-layer homology domain-containing protein [Acidimicrobiia bacterium]